MYIGLPQWHHSAWASIGLRDLADYARYFNCVEGNTTFYALARYDAGNFPFLFQIPLCHQP